MANHESPDLRALVGQITSKDQNQIATGIYARTSSPNQRFNYSIEEQVNECWRYCDERSWSVKYVFADDCVSGKNTDRPKFQLMLQHAEAKEIEAIIVWKIDRFCRSLVDLVNLERKLQTWGIALASCTEFVDTSNSIGRFNFRMLGSVAELEREQIGERARLGLYGLARQRKWPNSQPPLGYEKDADGRLVVDESQAKVVRHIFELYLELKSTPAVAHSLNKEGVTTRKGAWIARAVRDVLVNQIYVGSYSVAGFVDQVEEYRIVSDAIFDTVLRNLRRYRNAGAIRPEMPHDRRAIAIKKILDRFSHFQGVVNLQPVA